MRILITIFLIISLLSCNQVIKKSDSQIESFEKFFGENELNYLNEIIDDLDNYLAFNYPDQTSKFRKYLADISDLKVNKYWIIDTLKLTKYRGSNLFRKYETIYPDSVWFDGITFSIKFPDSELTEEIIPEEIFPLGGKSINLNIDSIINSLKKEPKRILIKQSDFDLSLSSIQKSDSLIISYIEIKEIGGDLSPSTLASGLLYYLTENNEYFAKRIFVMDMYDY